MRQLHLPSPFRIASSACGCWSHPRPLGPPWVPWLTSRAEPQLRLPWRASDIGAAPWCPRSPWQRAKEDRPAADSKKQVAYQPPEIPTTGRKRTARNRLRLNPVYDLSNDVFGLARDISGTTRRRVRTIRCAAFSLR
jgi:hypothetical protein